MPAIRAVATPDEAAAVLERCIWRGYCEVGNAVMLVEHYGRRPGSHTPTDAPARTVSEFCGNGLTRARSSPARRYR